jgi:adenylate cyclase
VGEDAKEFEAAGVYDPNAPNAEDRLATLRYLTDLGATVDQLVAAHKCNELPVLALELQLSADDTMTLDDVVRETGLPADRILALGQTVGLPPSDPDTLRFSQSDAASFRSVEIGRALFGEAATLHFGRIVGNAIARIAEASSSVFLMQVERPLLDRNANELEVAQAHANAAGMIDVIPEFMETLFHAHMLNIVRRVRRYAFEDTHDGLVTLAVGFVDIVGFTPLTYNLEPGALVDLVSEFEGRAMEIATKYDGRVIKSIGDEVMFAAADPASGCAIALELLDAFRDRGAVQARGGVHFGPALSWGGDLYGSTVNCASRVGELAIPHELLVTEALRSAAGGCDAFAFEPAGRRVLRGFPEPVALYSLTGADS